MWRDRSLVGKWRVCIGRVTRWDEKLACSIDSGDRLGVVIESASDGAYGMQNGGVITAERPRDLRKRERGELAGKEHGHLPSLRYACSSPG